MTNINNYFPQSDYIKCATLNGKEVTLTIAGVEQVEYQDGTKAPALSFQGTTKKLGLNKTNALRIARLHGDETESWPGKEIVLMPDITDFQGRQVDCVRVKVVQPAQPFDPGADQSGGLDDEIPF